jgi:mannose-6-phosphate isomerase
LYKKDQLKKDDVNFWAARAALTFNKNDKIDRGIFSVYFFNLLHLKKGQGIFQDAGVPHAYLEGQNVEIMANSDNVLRGGLTTKHIDVKELMKNIKFEETIPEVLEPKKIKDHEQHYLTAAPDFKLSRFELKEGHSSTLQSVTGEIILVVKGNVSIHSETDKIELKKGEAVFTIHHQKISLKALSEADLYRASVPVHNSE